MFRVTVQVVMEAAIQGQDFWVDKDWVTREFHKEGPMPGLWVQRRANQVRVIQCPIQRNDQRHLHREENDEHHQRVTRVQQLAVL